MSTFSVPAIDDLSEAGEKPSTVGGRVELRGVQFSYPARPDSLVMDDFNLTVEAGQTVALCGASGSGKSTTILLVERFYDPAAGTVTLDGRDLKVLNLVWLRQQIGLVSQEPTLFSGTIADNIAYGKPGCTREEVQEAAKSANAHDFITSFPDGYDTDVGSAGTQLSGGQKQRVAIARAIIKNPSVLLLPNGTALMYYRSGHPEEIGVATGPSWAGPFVRDERGGPIVAAGGRGNEDMFVWSDHRGNFHMLNHNLPHGGNVSIHGFVSTVNQASNLDLSVSGFWMGRIIQFFRGSFLCLPG